MKMRQYKYKKLKKGSSIDYRETGRLLSLDKKVRINYIVYFSLTLLVLYMSVFQRSIDDISRFFQVIGVYSGLLVSFNFVGIFFAAFNYR
ncbi:MAG: hypothetical protein PWR10_831 [Halanaerobiales bacterium]|nr:hypothetical protein [Halanaerobiales bacterium]